MLSWQVVHNPVVFGDGQTWGQFFWQFALGLSICHRFSSSSRALCGFLLMVLLVLISGAA